MCISIQVTCKQFITGFIFLTLSLGTYLGHLAIQGNREDVAGAIKVQCILVDSTPISTDGAISYHNNWDYIYENRTYYHTDKTDTLPENYMCCIDSDDSYQVVECVSDLVTEAILIIIATWIVLWGVCVCMWVDRKKYEHNRKSSVEMAQVNRNKAGSNV